jgi:hypothetical protein
MSTRSTIVVLPPKISYEKDRAVPKKTKNLQSIRYDQIHPTTRMQSRIATAKLIEQVDSVFGCLIDYRNIDFLFTKTNQHNIAPTTKSPTTTSGARTSLPPRESNSSGRTRPIRPTAVVERRNPRRREE